MSGKSGNWEKAIHEEFDGKVLVLFAVVCGIGDAAGGENKIFRDDLPEVQDERWRRALHETALGIVRVPPDAHG